jgi:CheY-like chemotaxis protein
MDCQMPVLDGYDTTLRIRDQERHRDLPVIAMTVNAMKGDREKVLSVGMNDHIAKPIKPDALFITMAKWITQTLTVPIDDYISVQLLP